MSESQRTNHTESSNTGAVIEDNNRPCYHQLDAIFREKENINSMFEFNHSDPHAKISDNGVGAMVGNKSISLENEDNEANMQSLDWLNQHHYCVWMKQMKKLIKNQIQLLQALNCQDHLRVNPKHQLGDLAVPMLCCFQTQLRQRSKELRKKPNKPQDKRHLQDWGWTKMNLERSNMKHELRPNGASSLSGRENIISKRKIK
ncbi:hypothetical protein VP01_2527g1 [Puccinia sorghi]|uniref:Uncharacterized protein n=1 Tax=Puccinia sorghi TaxID=27349 RepID=A0A0L6V5F7_9BASI|nr:hypothetical protein VP01_2527g1 [Puccinia sorghi]